VEIKVHLKNREVKSKQVIFSQEEEPFVLCGNKGSFEE
jgi:hypothetical protein